MTVTFCGHGSIYYDETIIEKLFTVLEQLINNGAEKFLLGGYGNFDKLSAKTVKTLKEKYPDINSIMVIPYLDRKYDFTLYDYTIYPPLENVPPKYSIIKRNEWMVDNSDIVVAYVNHSWGGAIKTLNYAKQKGKHIINLCDVY